jgi:ketosteroid isomerase-like protein
VTTNADIVRSALTALEAGDRLALMGLVARDVRWAVNAADRTAAPWFGVYEGKRSLVGMLDALADVTFTDITPRALLEQGDLVMTWSHVGLDGPDGVHVEMEEVMVWRVADGKVTSVDVLMDTGAVAAAFA